jgi:hypothetical protein
LQQGRVVLPLGGQVLLGELQGLLGALLSDELDEALLPQPEGQQLPLLQDLSHDPALIIIIMIMIK